MRLADGFGSAAKPHGAVMGAEVNHIQVAQEKCMLSVFWYAVLPSLMVQSCLQEVNHTQLACEESTLLALWYSMLTYLMLRSWMQEVNYTQVTREECRC